MEVSSYCAICAQPSVCQNGACLHRALYCVLSLYSSLPSSYILSTSLSLSLLILSSYWMKLHTPTHCTNAAAAKAGGSGITIDNFITDHNGCIASCDDDDDDDGNNICTYTTKVDLFASEFGYFYFEECEQGTTTTTTRSSGGGGSASSNTMPTIAMEVSENIIVYFYKLLLMLT